MKKLDYPPGATPISPEELEGLKLKHVNIRSELDRWEYENIQDALRWLVKRRRTDVLTQEFICQLHLKMFSKVWNWAGQFRRTEKNIGVSWVKIPMELRQLIDDAKTWIENDSYSPDEIAYRFHHRLVWVHLFLNGNGRHARLMADLILTEIFDLKPFTWGGKELSDSTEIRAKYIQSLRTADNYDYDLLKKFVRS